MIKVIVDGVEHKLDPDRDVQIDGSDLNREFIGLPALINSYGVLLEQAKAEVAAAKYDMERVYANEDCAAREDLKLNGVKFTEMMIANTAKTSEQYTLYFRKLLKLQRNVGMLKANCAALQSKENCLISLGAQERAGSSTARIMQQTTAVQVREDREEKVKRVISKSRKLKRRK